MGQETTNGFFYKPSDGESDYKTQFDATVDSADAQIQTNLNDIA